MKQEPTVRVVTATEAKNRFGEMLKGAYLRDEHLIVKRDGIPVAVIVPIMAYESMVSNGALPKELAEEVAIAAKRQRAHADLADFLREVHKRMPEVSEEEAEQDILEAIQAVRAERRIEREQQNLHD